MSGEDNCRKCGETLRGDALEGLCGKCLAMLAFEPGGESDGGSGNFPSFKFGDYELIEEIARGGMGVVYKANQKRLNRLVALKMILHGPFSSAEFVRRFQTEAETIARLKHPNIVTIYEVGERDGHHFLSMEFINGQSLADVVRENPLEPRRAAIYVQTIARAIHYAHEAGVVHRDLKPSNLLLDILDQPHVTDFGLAKIMASDSNITLTGQVIGSPGYMPPEHAAGKTNGNEVLGDIYSLGAVLYHLLTARAPFQGADLQEVVLQVQNNDPVEVRRLNPGVPVALETICLKCLQKEPGKRYATAKELAEDLERFLAGEPILARPVSQLEKFWLWSRRRPIQTALAGGLALAVMLGVSGVFVEWRQAEQNASGEIRQRQLAQDYARTMRLNLYAADVNLAARAIERGDVGRARQALDGLQPRPGEEDLRGFEWRYLKKLCQGDQLATLTGHDWTITCAAFSPDGKLLLTGSQDGTAKLWDVAGHKLLHTFGGFTAAVWSVDFTPDGSRVMIAGHKRGLELWDIKKFERLVLLTGEIAVMSHATPLIASADSSQFFWERCGKVTLWNYETGKKIRELSRPGRAPALSRDGALLATVAEKKGVDLWEVSTGRLIRSIATDEPVWSLAFSPAGDHLVTAGWSPEPKVWDLTGNLPPMKLSGHSRDVWWVTYSADGSNIVTTSSDQTIRFWDAATLKPGKILRGHGSEVWCAAFSSDGQMLASGSKDKTVRLWKTGASNPTDETPLAIFDEPLFSPDSQQMPGYSSMDKQEQPLLWDIHRNTGMGTLPWTDPIGFSPDGKWVAHLNQENGILEFWCPTNQSARPVELGGLPARELKIAQWGFSPSWETFFAIDREGMIRFWWADNGKLLSSLQGPKPPIRRARLGPEGRYLAVTLEREESARLYEVASGRLMELVGHHDFVSGLGFSPDGSQLATGSMDGTVKLWNVADGSEIATLPGHMDETTGVAFSPDGRTLASIGERESVIFWHVATHRELFSLPSRKAGSFVQFSPDGNRLAVAQADHSVQFLEAPSLAELTSDGN